MRPKIQERKTYRANGDPRSCLSGCDLSLCRDASQGNDPYILLLAFVIQEEECFILQDGAANRTAKLIVVKWRFGVVGGIEEIPRVEGVIAEILKCAAVDLVGSTPRHDVDHRAAVSSVLCLKVREYAHFAHGIDR